VDHQSTLAALRSGPCCALRSSFPKSAHSPARNLTFRAGGLTKGAHRAA
jgi:hypothetical protein